MFFDNNHVFFNVKDFPFIESIEKSYPLIKSECETIIKENQTINIQDVFIEQKKITTQDNWKSYFISIYGHEFPGRKEKCYHTLKAIKSIPGYRSAMFSILSPGKSIKPHRGPYKGILRYHLGLIVPKDYKNCWIKVNGEIKHWEEGKCMIFDDTFNHEAHNQSDSLRAILFVDFLRPLPLPLHLINMFIVYLIGKSQFAQNVLKRNAEVEKNSDLSNIQ